MIKETTLVKFHYPNVMIVKGCNEILLYSITEDLYYYTRLNSPILFEISTIYNPYGVQLKCLIDLGDYLSYADFTMTTGTSSYYSFTFHTRYMEKSTFPQQRLLAGFEPMSTKFKAKDEAARVLF